MIGLEGLGLGWGLGLGYGLGLGKGITSGLTISSSDMDSLESFSFFGYFGFHPHLLSSSDSDAKVATMNPKVKNKKTLIL